MSTLKAGEMTIFQMREKHPGYNLISNNCQQYALALLNHIQLGQHVEFEIGRAHV